MKQLLPRRLKKTTTKKQTTSDAPTTVLTLVLDQA